MLSNRSHKFGDSVWIKAMVLTVPSQGKMLLMLSLLVNSSTSFLVENNKNMIDLSRRASLDVQSPTTRRKPFALKMSDDWSGFSALDDDDDIVGGFDTTDYAAEEDTQDYKAQVGSAVSAPAIDRPAEPIFLPAGAYRKYTFLVLRCPCRSMRWHSSDFFIIYVIAHNFWLYPLTQFTGSQLDLTEENVLGVLSACREELGTLFGYSAENRGVGKGK